MRVIRSLTLLAFVVLATGNPLFYYEHYPEGEAVVKMVLQTGYGLELKWSAQDGGIFRTYDAPNCEWSQMLLNDDRFQPFSETKQLNTLYGRNSWERPLYTWIGYYQPLPDGQMMVGFGTGSSETWSACAPS